jgi:hypothetical protein
MHSIGRGLWRGVTVFAMSGLLAGCGSGMDLDEAPPELELESTQEAAVDCGAPDGCCDPAVYEDCSVTGYSAPNSARIVVTYYACPASAQSTTPSTVCRVEDGYYAIGGGAFTLGTFAAALSMSRPLVGSNGGWAAASKGILGPVNHSVKAYAVGMKLYNSAGRAVNIDADIHEHLFFPSSNGDRISGSVTVPAGQLLLGGGFTAGVEGTFAVDAYATGMLKGKWSVNGKQFRAGAPSLFGSAISLSRCLPASNPIVCFGPRSIDEETSAGGPALQAAVAANTHSAQAVVGAGIISSSWSRPIWAMMPLPPGPFGSSTQFGSAAGFTVAPTGASGSVTTQVMSIGF